MFHTVPQVADSNPRPLLITSWQPNNCLASKEAFQVTETWFPQVALLLGLAESFKGFLPAVGKTLHTSEVLPDGAQLIQARPNFVERLCRNRLLQPTRRHTLLHS